MKTSEILIYAAYLIDTKKQTFSCIAVDYSHKYPAADRYSAARIYYENIFPEIRTPIAILLNRSEQFNKPGGDEEVRQVQIMCLLMAAAIAESEGD